MNAVSVNTNEIKWQRAQGYAGGTEEKILSVGGSVAPRVTILKFPPGWGMEAHSHRFTELHYVLEGQLESEGNIYPAGTFRIIPKHVAHGPFSSSTGAVVLVIWCSLAEDIT
jgi:quercetin dioxygenase-like cupin family protein